MPKFVLISMVKNEEKILERCLNSVEGLVDAYVITDTGSTDKTTDIAQNFLMKHPGCLDVTTWTNFGESRTASFRNAKEYCEAKKWDLKDTYGILLDADMMLVPGTLKQQPLGALGYTIVQSAGNLDYPNTRVIRMDHDWVCRGVTHEYWDGPTQHLDKSICHIDDHNDGGCKGDKFPRDLALLTKGLEDEPDNVRYMFYLAQTYHSMGQWENSIEAYKKRIAAGGWFEEVWYSHYMISKTYLTLHNIPQAEEWVHKAHVFYGGRSEAFYHLVKYLRERGDHHKAMHYIQIGKRIPLPNDSLFIERDVYSGLFNYEETICRYYTMSTKAESLVHSIKYLMTDNPYHDNVYSNLQFYINPIAPDCKPVAVHRHLFGANFHPSAISVSGVHHNIRFVNYNLNHTNTTYTMKDGEYSDKNLVRTENACLNTLTGEIVLMQDQSVNLPRNPTHIRGLEDVRIYRNSTDDLCFVATAGEYSDRLSIIRGKYDPDSGKYSDCVVMQSPRNAYCEKNWLPISGTENFIYQWHPLEIRTFVGTQAPLHKSHETPQFFKHFRGSAAPIKVKNELWALTHFVIGERPRIYYHCIVVMDDTTYRPKRISVPFLFYSKLIEFCINLSVSGSKITCMFAILDEAPYTATFSLSDDQWIQV